MRDGVRVDPNLVSFFSAMVMMIPFSHLSMKGEKFVVTAFVIIYQWETNRFFTGVFSKSVAKLFKNAGIDCENLNDSLRGVLKGHCGGGPSVNTLECS